MRSEESCTAGYENAFDRSLLTTGRDALVSIMAPAKPPVRSEAERVREGHNEAKEGHVDAIELLEQDHKKVKELLEKVGATDEDAIEERRSLFDQIRKEMQTHELIEEQIFYPALKDHPKAKDVVLEGYEEHHAVDVLLDELDDVPFDDERWSPKMTVIKENIEHHIEEEEEEMFEKARSILDEDELDELGRRMKELKDKES